MGRLSHQQARKTDPLARWGGEEFIIVLAGAAEERGLTAAERFRNAIARLEVRDARGELVPVTASMGLARLEPGEGAGSFVVLADRAMYAAKTAGRIQVPAAPARVLQLQK